MRIRLGIIQEYALLEDTLLSLYPICETVTIDKLCNLDVFVIFQNYKIGHNAFQIFEIWYQYLMRNAPEKKLIVLGNFANPTTNFVTLTQVKNLEQIIVEAKSVQTMVNEGINQLPDTSDLDIRKPIASCLQSHNDNLNSLLVKLKEYFKTYDTTTTPNYYDPELVSLILKLEHNWNHSLQYVKLTPIYSKLLPIKRILFYFSIKNKHKFLSIKRINELLRNIIEITLHQVINLYDLEKGQIL